MSCLLCTCKNTICLALSNACRVHGCQSRARFAPTPPPPHRAHPIDPGASIAAGASSGCCASWVVHKAALVGCFKPLWNSFSSLPDALHIPQVGGHSYGLGGGDLSSWCFCKRPWLDASSPWGALAAAVLTCYTYRRLVAFVWPGGGGGVCQAVVAASGPGWMAGLEVQAHGELLQQPS